MLIPIKIREILSHLENNGHAAYIVGGAVRDYHLGKTPKDWDIATSAEPEQVIATFKQHAYIKEVKQIDAAFPVVTVDGVEVATFRVDIYEGEDQTGVKIISDLVTDLGRRDLTINAMAMSKDYELIDPFNGQGDLDRKIVRFVGDAATRISEDPCRLIRACRFAAAINGSFTKETFEALRVCNHFLLQVPRERIRIEILKAMSLEHAGKFFRALHHTGMLGNILPSLEKCWKAEHGQYHTEDIFEHMAMAGDSVPNSVIRAILTDDQGLQIPLLEDLDNETFALLRLTAFLHDVGKSQPNFKDGVIHFYDHEIKGVDILKDELKNLKFSTDEIKFITGLVAVHMRGSTKMSPKTTRKVIKKFVDLGVNWKHWLVIKISDRAGAADKNNYSNNHINKLVKKFLHELDDRAYEKGPRDPNSPQKACFEHKELAISGTTIRKVLGIGPSQFVGVALDYLLKRVIDNPELNTRDQLIFLLTGKKEPVSVTTDRTW